MLPSHARQLAGNILHLALILHDQLVMGREGDVGELRVQTGDWRGDESAVGTACVHLRLRLRGTMDGGSLEAGGGTRGSVGVGS